MGLREYTLSATTHALARPLDTTAIIIKQEVRQLKAWSQNVALASNCLSLSKHAGKSSNSSACRVSMLHGMEQAASISCSPIKILKSSEQSSVE